MKNSLTTKQVSIFLVLIILGLSSCNMEDKIEVGEPEDVVMGGLKNNKVSLIVSIPIKNMNGFKVKIKAVDLEARVDDKYLGVINLGEEVIIEPKTSGVHNVPLELEVKNIILGAQTLMKLTRNNTKPKLSIEGTILTGGLIFNKKIPIYEQNLLKYME